MRWLHLLAAVLVAVMLSVPARAVQPDEMLKDPALETRARGISAGLRCLVCQNQSIDESDAGVARDLRILIREQLLQNKTDGEIIAFVVDRYGDYVLLKPRLTGETLILWFTPFLILLGGAAFFILRRKTAQSQPAEALTDAEKAALERIVRE